MVQVMSPLPEGRKDAVQEQGATEVHARQAPSDSPEVGQAHEQEAVQASTSEETEISPVTPQWAPVSDPIERRGGWSVDKAFDGTPDPLWPGMPRATFKRIGLYLRFAADKVGLRDWAFNLRWNYYTEDEDATAAVRVIRGQKRATVWLCKEFADMPESEQRHALIHELLHCHLDPIEQCGWSIAQFMGQAAHGIFRDNLHQQIELAVDAIACEWSAMLPGIHTFDQEDDS